MKIRIILGLVLCLMISQSCYEDLGNYQYKETNKITFSLNPAVREGFLGEAFVYYPKLTFSNPQDTTGFEYWWEYTGETSTPGRVDTVCLGRELNFIPTKVGYLNMRLCALELSTGTIQSAGLQITSKSAMAKGWAILSDEGGKSSLSFVRPTYRLDAENEKVREYIPYVNIYQTLYPQDPLGSGPVKLGQLGNFSESLLFVMQKNSAVYLDGNSFAKAMLLEKEFVGGVNPSGFVIGDFFYGTRMDLLMNDKGEVYSRNYMQQGEYQPFFTASWSNIPTEVEGEKLIVDRFITTSPTQAGHFGIYQAAKKRVLWVNQSSTGGDFLPSVVSEDPGIEYVNLNDFKDWDCLFIGCTGTENRIVNVIAIFRKGDEVIFQQQQGFLPQIYPEKLELSSISVRSFSGKDHVTENTLYYPLMTRPYLFFAEKNTIYWYDIVSGITHAFYSFPSGTKIVTMSSNPQESELGIVTENGLFATLNIKNEMLYAGEKLYELSGLGKIVHMTYKYPNNTDYVFRTIYTD